MRNKNSYQAKKKYLIILIFIILVIILRHPLNTAKNKVNNFIIPLKTSIYKFSFNLKNTIDNFVSVNKILKENSSLKEKISSLKLNEEEYKKISLENERLRKLLEMKKRKDYKIEFAKLSYRNAMSIYKEFYIDKGKNDGIELNMPVLYNNMLIGRIEEVLEDDSKVMMITNEKSKVSIKLGEEKNLGVLVGNNNNTLYVDYIIVDSEVKIEDEIKTSGVSEYYPDGVLIGKVEKINKSRDNLFKKIEVSLPYNVLDVNEVMILKR